MGGLLERFLYGMLVLLACLRRLEAAHFAFDGEGSGYGVARAAATDPADIDAGLIVGKRTVWVVGRAKDVDSVDGLRQVLAGMAGAAGDLHVERFVGCSPGDDHAWFKGIIEDNTIGDVPRRTVKAGRAAEASLLLDREEKDQGWVWQLLFKRAPHYLQDDHYTSGIIGAEIGGAIAVENAVAQDGLVAKAGWHAIHMSIEQEGRALSGERRDEVT